MEAANRRVGGRHGFENMFGVRQREHDETTPDDSDQWDWARTAWLMLVIGICLNTVDVVINTHGGVWFWLRLVLTGLLVVALTGWAVETLRSRRAQRRSGAV